MRVVVVDDRRAGHLERSVERIGTGRVRRDLAIKSVADRVRDEGAERAVMGAPRER